MASKLETMHPAWFAAGLSSAGVALMLMFDPITGSEIDHYLGLVVAAITAVTLVVTISLMTIRYFRFRSAVVADFEHPNFGPLFAAAPAGVLVFSIALGELMTQGVLARDVFEPITAAIIAIGTLGTLLVGFLFYTYIVDHQELPLLAMNGSWFIPVVPLILIPNSLIRLINDTPTELEQWKTAAFLASLALGTGLFLFGLLASIVGYRLLTQPAPPAHAVATWWIWLAPIGVGGLGILATAKLFTTATAEPMFMHLTHILTSIFWGIGIWWLAFASFAIWRVRKEIHFHVGLWGFGFPSASFTSLTILFNREFWDFAAIEWLATGFAIATIALYGYLIWLTMVSVKSGKAFKRA